MTNTLRYKGYFAKPEYSAEDQIFYGKILGITDLVDFYSEDARELQREFELAVDDYLAFCKEIGKEPQRAYSGSFNVRVSPELHKKAALQAQAEGTTLNRIVENAIKNYLEEVKNTFTVLMPVENIKAVMELDTVQTEPVRYQPHGINYTYKRTEGRS